jgi:hypothetical protein
MISTEASYAAHVSFCEGEDKSPILDCISGSSMFARISVNTNRSGYLPSAVSPILPYIVLLHRTAIAGQFTYTRYLATGAIARRGVIRSGQGCSTRKLYREPTPIEEYRNESIRMYSNRELRLIRCMWVRICGDERTRGGFGSEQARRPTTTSVELRLNWVTRRCRSCSVACS